MDDMVGEAEEWAGGWLAVFARAEWGYQKANPNQRNYKFANKKFSVHHVYFQVDTNGFRCGSRFCKRYLLFVFVSYDSTDALTGFHVSARRRALTPFNMPAMSPTMTEGGIASWKKKEGESFVAGDVLLEIVSIVFTCLHPVADLGARKRTRPPSTSRRRMTVSLPRSLYELCSLCHSHIQTHFE